MRTAFLTQLITIMICITFSSCKSKEAVAEETNMPTPKTILSELFDERPYRCIFNEQRDLQLCFADDDPQGDRLRKVYAVYDLEYKMIYGPKRVHGNVSWADNDQLLIEILPRVVHREDSGNRSKKKIINIRENHKI